MKFLPICKPFFLSHTMTCLEYMPWFRVADKPYLLLMEARSRQLHQKRHDDCLSSVGPEEVPQQHHTMHPISVSLASTFFEAPQSPANYAPTLMATPLPSSMPKSIPTLISMYSGFVTLYCYLPVVLQTPNVLLFNRCGLLVNHLLVKWRTYDERLGRHHT